MKDPLDEVRRLLDEGAPEAALETLESIEQRLLTAEEQRDYFHLAASVFVELGDIDSARESLDDGLASGEDAALRSMEARVHLASGDYEKALDASERAVQLDPRDADARHVQGVVLTFLGRLKDADRAFARAAELEPGTYFEPYRLRRRDFDEAVEEALGFLSEEFRRHLENVEVAVEDVPTPDLVEGGMADDLLGLYQGQTVHAEEWGFPDRILLFQRSIENVSPDRPSLLREIRDTVLHEVGHHFGLDEDRIRAIEDTWDED